MPDDRKGGLTDGAVIALARLKDGDKLEQQRNRSRMTWLSDGTCLHHLTFKNLEQVGAVKKVKGKARFTTFGITTTGKRLSR